MANEKFCPAGCSANLLDQIQVVSREDVGITPKIATAARLHPRDQILFCTNCKSVMQRLFDVHLLRHREVVLGEYDLAKSEFRPSPSLKRALDVIGNSAGNN